MDFSLSQEQLAIVDAVASLCRDFDDEYWASRDRSGQFPSEFHQAMAKAGWLGIAMPSAHGGAGLGILEAALVVQAVAASGAAEISRQAAAAEPKCARASWKEIGPIRGLRAKRMRARRSAGSNSGFSGPSNIRAG